MKTKIILGLLVITLLWSCSTTIKYTWTKESFKGKTFDKVLVITLTKNLKSRTLFENTVAELLNEEGINATNGLKVITPVEDAKKLTEDEIGERIKAGGYDAVLVTTLIDVNTRDVQVNNYNYYPYIYGGRYGYGYNSFIYSSYNYMWNDQYREEKTYVLETRLYDVNETNPKEAVVWSGQSELVDPSGSDSASKMYSNKLVKTLMESGTIKIN